MIMVTLTGTKNCLITANLKILKELKINITVSVFTIL